MRAAWLWLALLVLLAGCSISPAPTPLPTPGPGSRATRIAEDQEVAAELTATAVARSATQTVEALPTVTPTPSPTRTPAPPPTIAPPPTPTTARAAPVAPPAGPTSTPAGPRVDPTRPGLPAFSDLVVDDARHRLYGADRLGGRILALSLPALDVVGTIPLGQASRPAGMALSPDGAELAVALSGAGNIALVDPAILAVTGRLYPRVEYGPNMPWDVRYIGPHRLVSVGNPGSSGFDYIHLFDTAGRAELGHSTDIIRGGPNLAVTADGTIFASESSFSPQQIYRFALDGNTPVEVAHGPHGPVLVPALAARRDGSAVYTAGGQVWSGNLQSQLGSFSARGVNIEYVPATERLFVCQESAVVEVQAQGNYDVVATHPVSATARVARANAAGTVLYVSTDAGLDVVPLTH